MNNDKTKWVIFFTVSGTIICPIFGTIIGFIFGSFVGGKWQNARSRCADRICSSKPCGYKTCPYSDRGDCSHVKDGLKAADLDNFFKFNYKKY